VGKGVEPLRNSCTYVLRDVVYVVRDVGMGSEMWYMCSRGDVCSRDVGMCSRGDVCNGLWSVLDRLMFRLWA
jgi:hypothetical protein